MQNTKWSKRLVVQCENEDEYLLLMAWYENKLNWRWKDSTLPTYKKDAFTWHQHNNTGPVFIEYKNYFYAVHFAHIDCVIITFKLFSEIFKLKEWKETLYIVPMESDEYPSIVHGYGALAMPWNMD